MFLNKLPTKDKHMLTLNVDADDEILSIINFPGSSKRQNESILLPIVAFVSFNKALKFWTQLLARVFKLYVTSNFTKQAGNSYSVNYDLLDIKKQQTHRNQNVEQVETRWYVDLPRTSILTIR